MRYVTFDATGMLTGCYQQDLHEDHVGAYLEISDEQAINWPSYRMNSSRDGVEPAPLPVPHEVVPQSIPALNGRIAMIQAGWMPAVRAVLDSMGGIEGEIAREYFNNSLTYERNHPLVQAVPAAIGKTQDEVDSLFIQAGAMHV